MRSIMGKFNIPSSEPTDAAPYAGGPLPALSQGEREQVRHIEAGDLSHQQAADILKDMDPNTPMQNLEEFVGLVAAVVAVYPERMDTKHDKTTLRRVLINACTPERFQWYMNSARYRSAIPKSVEASMGAGTTRNEQLHARLNSHFHTTVAVSRRTLTAEVNTWLLADMMVCARALNTKPCRRLTRSDMGPYVFSTTKPFSKATWAAFREEPLVQWKSDPKKAKKALKRRGPSAEQLAIYKSIKEKTIKRPRSTIFRPR